MPKHANFDEIDHLKAYFNSSCQCDHGIHTFIKVTIKDRSLIKTKKVPHVKWTKHYQNHGYMCQLCTQSSMYDLQPRKETLHQPH